jgi:hypothetical protein
MFGDFADESSRGKFKDVSSFHVCFADVLARSLLPERWCRT